MTRKYIGPRLYKYTRKGCEPVWFVRDGDVLFTTGCPESELEKAEGILRVYIKTGLRPQPRQGSRSSDRAGTIYFASTNEFPDYPIKIGIAFTDVWSRVKDIQSTSPYRLVILHSFPGSTRGELTLHARFISSRLNGEWFRRTPELLDLIESLKAEAA